MDKVSKVIKKTKGSSQSFVCDVTHTSKFNTIVNSLKRLDILVNNAGNNRPEHFTKVQKSDMDYIVNLNLKACFNIAQICTKKMLEAKNRKKLGGSIINMASGAGIMGFPLRSPYAASKWAVVGITKTLAMELGKFKVRVNAICPGTIKGDRMVRVIRDKAKFLKISKKSIEKEFISMASINSWVYEEDIGYMCSFLISDDAKRISGQIIGVDGNATRLD